MADVDIDCFGDHGKTNPDETGEAIPLNPGGVVMRGGATWEPKREQETSVRGKIQRARLKEAQVEGLYRKLSENHMPNLRSILF